MAEVKRIGIIGLGAMGQRHCQAVVEIPDAKLVAVCDLREDRVSQIKAKYQVPNGFTDWEKMIKGEKLDLIIVATNGPTHATITIAAAQAGIKRIFCEKPVSTSVKSAQEMIKICKKKDVRLAVNHLRRWVPAYVRLKKLLSGGVIGDIRHITFEMAGGQLASIGGHFFDLVRFLTDKDPRGVLGYLDRTGTPNPRGAEYSDPGGYGLMWLEDDIRIFFDLSEDYGVPFFLEILGSVGRVTIDEKAAKWTISARKEIDRSQPFTKRPPLADVPFEGQSVAMIAACKIAIEELMGDGPVSCTGEDGLQSLMMVMAVHFSDTNSNKIVPLPLSKKYSEIEFQFT